MRALLWLMLAAAAFGGAHHWWQGAEPTLHPDDPRTTTGDTGIVMLAAEWCGYCQKQRRDFERAKVRYRLLDVDTEAGAHAAQALGVRGVPVTVVGQAVIQGYDTAMLGEKLTPLGYNVY